MSDAMPGWDDAIDCLRLWAKDPAQLDEPEDGIVGPSARILRLAIRLALIYQSEDRPAPLRVVPNGEGGVVFEFEFDTVFYSITIDDRQRIEFMLLVDCRLVHRFWMNDLDNLTLFPATTERADDA